MLTLLWFSTILDESNAREVSSETEEWTRYSVALHILLPVAGFCILWGKRDLLTRLMLQIDRNCISVFCPSFSQREKLLKWASENLPTTWSSPSKTLSGGIPDLWKDGSLMCTLINMVVPGACPNPPKHWRKSPTHAQALAFKYLGVTPVFTESDFEGPFSPTQEKKFLMYLKEIQLAMKNHSEGNESLNFTSAYLTKGMGLQTGEQYRKTIFYVYSNSTSSNCNNILVYIRGPYGTRGTATIPAFYNLNSVSVLDYSHKLRASGQILFKKETRKSFLKSIALDITSFVNLERKVSPSDVPIHVEMENERAKVTYIPNNYGIYEINLITNGEILKGSPFAANIVESLSGVKDSFDSTEKILKELPAIRKKRIVSRFIDCINEKIELNIEEEDNRKKGVIEDIVHIVSNKGDSTESDIPAPHINTLSTPQHEIQHDNKVYSSETFEKLEKINEDQNENETESLSKDNYFRSENTLEGGLSGFSSVTASSFNIIPSVSVTEPEEELDTLPTTMNNDNHLEDSAGHSSCDYLSKLDTRAVNCSESDEKSDINPMEKLDTNKIEGNRIEAIASVKPFMQYTEQIKTQVDNEQSTLENMIGDQNENNFNEIHDATIDVSECLNSKDTVERRNFRQIKEDIINLTENTNRPTSIVTPFMQIKKCSTNENEQVLLEVEENSNNVLVNSSINENEGGFHTNIHENEFKRDDMFCYPKYESNKTNHRNKFIETSINYFSSVASGKEMNDEKRSSHEYLANEIGHNYVENLKAILMTKMNSQQKTQKTVKDFINTTNKLKFRNEFDGFQDENNNEFKHESPITSSICSDHIAQEVETPTAQSFGEKSLSERRKFFTRQQCLSVSSSNNSSISERENEDVCEQLDGHKYNLRVLTVIDTIKKSTNTHVLNRNTSMSVPNISKRENIEDHNSSSYTPRATNEFKSAFLKTREYWKKMLSENCFSTAANDSMHGKEHLNISIRNLRNSLSYSPDIHRSADDILSMSVNFRTNKLRRYSSLNQKDLEAIDFISIEERKKRLLRDKYEDECIGRKYILKRTSSKKLEYNDPHQTEDIQVLRKPETEERLDKDSFTQSTLSDNADSKSILPYASQEGKNVTLKKESQFKRAIKFFKNLEESASGKRKPTEQKKCKPEIKRRFSLDIQKHHKNKLKPGGSLRVPKTLEKFSITQIYFDIMSNGRGSFKGSPNRKALSETLASLATNDTSKKIQDEDSEDCIEYNMFVNKLKTKKRKSIKSVFDIHY